MRYKKQLGPNYALAACTRRYALSQKYESIACEFRSSEIAHKHSKQKRRHYSKLVGPIGGINCQAPVIKLVNNCDSASRFKWQHATNRWAGVETQRQGNNNIEYIVGNLLCFPPPSADKSFPQCDSLPTMYMHFRYKGKVYHALAIALKTLFNVFKLVGFGLGLEVWLWIEGCGWIAGWGREVINIPRTQRLLPYF